MSWHLRSNLNVAVVTEIGIELSAIRSKVPNRCAAVLIANSLQDSEYDVTLHCQTEHLNRIRSRACSSPCSFMQLLKQIFEQPDTWLVHHAVSTVTVPVSSSKLELAPVNITVWFGVDNNAIRNKKKKISLIPA